MDTIGTDNHIGCRCPAVSESQLDPGGAFLDADTTTAEVQPRPREAVTEGLQERDAVHAVIRGTERRFVGSVTAHRVLGDDLAAVPAPDDQRRGHNGDRLDLLAEPKPPQFARAIGRQGHRSTDFPQLAGLLVDLAVDAALPQGERERQSADPAPDDGHPELRHDAQATAGVRTGARAKS